MQKISNPEYEKDCNKKVQQVINDKNDFCSKGNETNCSEIKGSEMKLTITGIGGDSYDCCPIDKNLYPIRCYLMYED